MALLKKHCIVFINSVRVYKGPLNAYKHRFDSASVKEIEDTSCPRMTMLIHYIVSTEQQY